MLVVEQKLEKVAIIGELTLYLLAYIVFKRSHSEAKWYMYMHVCISMFCAFFYSAVMHVFTFIASRMWCLARMLPIMIREPVSENDQHWENFLLLTIADYVFAL